jgi:hypothetical protein
MYLDEPKFTPKHPPYIKKYFLMYLHPLKRYIWFIWFIKRVFTAIPPEMVGILALSAHPLPLGGSLVGE